MNSEKETIEMTLGDFFSSYLKLKYFFLTLFILFASSCAYYVYIEKPQWLVSVKLSYLDEEQYFDFIEFNNFFLRGQQLSESDNNINQNTSLTIPLIYLSNDDESIFISKKYLFNLYIDEILKREEIIKSLLNFNLIDKADYSSIDLYNIGIAKYASSFEINSYSQERDVVNNVYLDESKFGTYLEFTTESKDINGFLLNVLDKANKKVRDHLIVRLNKTVKTYIENKNIVIEELENRYEIEKKRIKSDIQKFILFLEEQADIAKSLNIEDSSYFNQVIDNHSEAIELLDDDTSLNIQSYSLYLRGYKAIEREIELKKSNLNNQLKLNNDLNEILFLIEFYKNDSFERHYQELMADHILYDSENFKAANYDIYGVIFENTARNKLLIILSFFISFTLVTIFISFIHSVFLVKKN